ncbi:hypothetical protein Y032_0338g2947 [Ancylostoma ceylanicum]|uniref:Uncharacterized protein n=1 Tax=Ancylostoma ceylanicum TaxID=53326 RepID=A0A016RY85_9BILA|nr:hypothetical protein Y032_0338g2947 [Ancylostoma ceylanicum]
MIYPSSFCVDSRRDTALAQRNEYVNRLVILDSKVDKNEWGWIYTRYVFPPMVKYIGYGSWIFIRTFPTFSPILLLSRLLSYWMM